MFPRMFPESEFLVLVDTQEILGKVDAADTMMDPSGCDGDINARFLRRSYQVLWSLVF